MKCPLGTQIFGDAGVPGGRPARTGLLDLLVDAGLNIGLREREAVAVLMAEVLARRGEGPPLSDFRPLLAPLLARSTSERECFFRIFDALAPTDPDASQMIDPKMVRSADDGKKGTSWRAIWTWLIPKRWRRPLLIAAGLAVVIFAVFVWQRWQRPEPYFDWSTSRDGSQKDNSLQNLIGDSRSKEAVKIAPKAEEVLNRIVDAAALFDGAPTIEELASELARQSPIGWTKTAYARRLQDLTGFSRYRPLPIVAARLPDAAHTEPSGQNGTSGISGAGQSERNSDALARLAVALSQIETPGSALSVDEFWRGAQLVALADAANNNDPYDPFAAAHLAEALAKALSAGQIPEDARDAVISAAGSRVSDNFTDDALERALAISPVLAFVLSDGKCLAEAVYNEARNKNDLARQAVADRILSQLGDRPSAGSICTLVNESAGQSNSATPTPKNSAQWLAAKRISANALLTHFHHAVLPYAPLRKPGQSAPRWVTATPAQGANFAPGWLRWIAAALPLLLGLYWLLNSLTLRKAFLRRRPPKFPPLHMDLLANVERLQPETEQIFHRVGQKLLQRSDIDTDRLDVMATVRATVNSGTQLVIPQYAKARVQPEYLFLIERRGAADQSYEHMRSMALRLRGVVGVDIFSYQCEPSMVEPDEGGRSIAIETLALIYPNHRLVILGTGAEFLDPLRGTPLPGADALMNWARRAMLTPVPLSEWQGQEFLLAYALSLPIGRATPEGLSGLAGMLRLDGADTDLLVPAGDGVARPLPEPFRADPHRYLDAFPPADQSVEEVITNLRDYLDVAAFDWLCAMAVYPAIQWDLTLYLGVNLPAKTDGDPGHEPVFREDRIAALTQLPWLREARMPDWLRRGLIAAMAPARAKQVRAVLNRMLAAAQSTNDGARDEAIRIRIGQEHVKEKLLPQELFDDEVLIDFLARGRIEDFELPFSGALGRLLPDEFSCRFGLPELEAAAIAIGYALTAFVVAPGSADGALVTGAWLPLLILPIGALAVWSLICIATGRAGRWIVGAGQALFQHLGWKPDVVAVHSSQAKLRWTAAGFTLLAFGPVVAALLLDHNLAVGHALLPNPSGSPETATIATTPNGKYFAVAGSDGAIRVFATNEPTHVLVRYAFTTARIRSLAIQDFPQMPIEVAAVSDDGDISIYNDPQGSTALKDPMLSGLIPTMVALDSQGGLAVAYETLKQKSPTRGVLFVPGHGTTKIPDGVTITALTAAAPGKFIYGLEDGTVGVAVVTAKDVVLHPADDIYEVTNRPVQELQIPRLVSTKAFGLSHDGNTLFVASPSGVDEFDFESGKKLKTNPMARGTLRNAVYAPASYTVAAVGNNGLVTIFALDTDDKPDVVLSGLKTPTLLALSNDASRFAMQDGDAIAVFDVNSKRRVALFSGYPNSVRAAAFSGHNNSLMIVTADGDIDILAANGSKHSFYIAQNKPYRSAEFSEDGELLILGSDDGRIEVFDRAGKLQLSMFTSDAAVNHVSFSPSCDYILAASEDGNLRVFDANSGQQLYMLSLDNTPVESAAFSGNGSTIAAISQKGTIGTWSMSSLARGYIPGIAVQSLFVEHSSKSVQAFGLDGSNVTARLKNDQLEEPLYHGTLESYSLGPAVPWGSTRSFHTTLAKGAFQWPVRGRVIAEFGSYGGGERNNGINIAATRGEPIRAADDGSVSYAGNELRGYGNLLLIRHDNGYITAYAHADEYIVVKGQRVARGEVIGYIGMTGDVRSPQLHFELRRGRHGETPINPRPMLGPLLVASH